MFVNILPTSQSFSWLCFWSCAFFTECLKQTDNTMLLALTFIYLLRKRVFPLNFFFLTCILREPCSNFSAFSVFTYFNQVHQYVARTPNSTEQVTNPNHLSPALFISDKDHLKLSLSLKFSKIAVPPKIVQEHRELIYKFTATPVQPS